MSDLLVDLSQHPLFRQTVKQLGLPLPMPEKLRRARGPWEERPLQDRAVVVFTAGGALGTTLAATLAPAGATPHVVGEATDLRPFVAPGEAFGRPPLHHVPGAEAPEDLRAHALVFDATSLRSPAELRALYDGLHPYIGSLARCGRVLVLGRPPRTAASPAAAATATALEGFVRAVAKEVGRKGATAHVVYVAPGAEARLVPLLRFLLSDRSAFLTGQPWTVDATATDAADAPFAPPFVRPLEGRTALVTGAARGIGAAIARHLAAEGARVICLDRPGDEAPLAQVAAEIKGTPFALDITDAAAPERLVAHVKDAPAGGPGVLDIVVHNAGITRDKTLGRMSPEYWDQAVAVNLGAVVSTTGALLEEGLADDARIICLSSVSGLAGNVGQTNYSASKAGVVGYVRALAPLVAPRGITVNAIAPGFIETRLTAAMPAVTREVARRLSALGQGGEPRDIAELVTFLASPGGKGLTGQSLRACGGMFIGA
jgi:3-oxoacyl-[acyl-carrier protein] reductase